jgi:hypothetical protein
MGIAVWLIVHNNSELQGWFYRRQVILNVRVNEDHRCEHLNGSINTVTLMCNSTRCYIIKTTNEHELKVEEKSEISLDPRSKFSQTALDTWDWKRARSCYGDGTKWPKGIDGFYHLDKKWGNRGYDGKNQPPGMGAPQP